MVATSNLGPAPKGLTLPVVGDDGRPYRGETAAPPPGEAEAVRRAITGTGFMGLADAAEQVFRLADIDFPLFPAQDAYGRAKMAVVQVISRLLSLSQAQHKRREVTECYHELRRVLCQSALGVQTGWPQGFWETLLGRLLYVAFYDAYGETLMLNQDVAKDLSIDLSRVGQIERLGLLAYIENPWVAHRMQRRRRVSPDMVADYRNQTVA